MNYVGKIRGRQLTEVGNGWYTFILLFNMERCVLMWVSDRWTDYELIDCGRGEKLERWGDQLLVRPDPQARSATPSLRLPS